MKKIKLDPFTIALIVLVLLVVISIAGRYFNSMKSRVSELEKQMHKDLQLLKLNQKKQDELARKAIIAYRYVISALFLIFISLVSLGVAVGISYIDAIEIHLGTMGILIAAITTIFYQTWNPDILLTVLRDKIKEWIYKKNGFDPTMIELIKDRIKVTQIEIESVKTQLVENL